MITTTPRLVARTFILCLALVVALGGDAPARAADKSPAEQLHAAAVAAHKRGNLRQAVELWSDALKLDASWKYAYNLANTQYERGEGVAAWEAVRRAQVLGPPEKHLGLVVELQSKVRALLFKDHALLVVDTKALPPGSVVSLDGARLEPPFEVWTTATSSTLDVHAEGFVAFHNQVVHPLGERTDVAPRLVAQSVVVAPTGKLAITGPAGATLWIGGVERGRLPLAPLVMPVGTTSLRLERDGFVPVERDVTITAEQVTALVLQLDPVVVAKPPERHDLTVPGWIIAGGGAALIATGAGFLVWAGDTQDELEQLNGSPEALAKFASYDAYTKHFQDTRDAMDDRALAGQILLVAGGVAVVTGIAFILLDDDAPADGDVVGVVPITGGAALVGGAKF